MNEFKFEPTIVTENNKSYVLSKNIKAVGPLVPAPYPYYQVEPKEQITEGDIVLFQTTIKPEIPTANAVQLGTALNGDVLDLADFVEVGETAYTAHVLEGECLISITKAEASTIINYVYVQPDSEVGSEGFEFIVNASSDDITRYYKHIQPETTGTPTSPPIGIKFINTNDNNKLIFSVEDDSGENDGVGNIRNIVSTSVVNFDFSAMDVEPNEPTQSINTKKEFKTTK